MWYNVFDSQTQAEEAQAVDANMFFMGRPVCSPVTTRWALPRQRLDNKWVYQVCPVGVQTHTQEEFSSGWFPSEEI